jgi:hypothetical protein
MIRLLGLTGTSPRPLYRRIEIARKKAGYSGLWVDKIFRAPHKAIVHALDQTVGLRESCLISALIPVRGFKELH